MERYLEAPARVAYGTETSVRSIWVGFGSGIGTGTNEM